MKSNMDWESIMKDWRLVRDEQDQMRRRISSLEESIYQILDWRDEALAGETRNIPADLNSPVFESIKESLDRHLETP